MGMYIFEFIPYDYVAKNVLSIDGAKNNGPSFSCKVPYYTSISYAGYLLI